LPQALRRAQSAAIELIRAATKPIPSPSSSSSSTSPPTAEKVLVVGGQSTEALDKLRQYIRDHADATIEVSWRIVQ
jgi:hypothetical protein